MSNGVVVLTTLLSIITVALVSGVVLLMMKPDSKSDNTRYHSDNVDRLLHHFATVIDSPSINESANGTSNESANGTSNESANGTSSGTTNSSPQHLQLSPETITNVPPMPLSVPPLLPTTPQELVPPIVCKHYHTKKYYRYRNTGGRTDNGLGRSGVSGSSNMFQFDAFASTSPTQPKVIFKSSSSKQRTLKLKSNHIYMSIVEILAIGETSKNVYTSKMQFSYKVDNDGNVVSSSPTNLRLIMVDDKNWSVKIKFSQWTMNIVAKTPETTENVKWMANVRVIKFN